MALLVHKSFADELEEGAEDAVADALATVLPEEVDDQLAAKLPGAIAAYFAALPTEDPEVEGEPWNDGGTIKISAGA